jgi:hypothetical protein
VTPAALAAGPSARRQHVEREEYFSWLETVFGTGPRVPGQEGVPAIKSRRYHYNRFLMRWPDLEEWFAAPLLSRLDVGPDGTPETSACGKRNGPSVEAGPYLIYLSMAHRIPLDADYVLSRNFDSLLAPRVAPALGVDLELFDCLDQRQHQIGYTHGRTSLTWAITRLLLWRGDPDITTITYDDIAAFGEETRRWCALPEAPLIRTLHVHSTRRNHDPAVLAPRFEDQCRARLHSLHVMLFNVGQIAREPVRGLRGAVIWKRQLVPPGTRRQSPPPSAGGWLAGCRALTGLSRSAAPGMPSATCSPGWPKPTPRSPGWPGLPAATSRTTSPTCTTMSTCAPAAPDSQDALRLHQPADELLPGRQRVGLGRRPRPTAAQPLRPPQAPGTAAPVHPA